MPGVIMSGDGAAVEKVCVRSFSPKLVVSQVSFFSGNPSQLLPLLLKMGDSWWMRARTPWVTGRCGIFLGVTWP